MAIEVRNVSFSYSLDSAFETKVLDGVSFRLEHGENLGILGPTGSGKSTLIQLLNALLIPTQGEVLVDGLNTKDKKNGSKIRELVGVVFQYPENQFFEDKVYDEIAFGARNLKLSEEKVRERVLEAINFLELSADILQKSPFEISGGEKRKVAIASILVRKPKYLVLDEPFAGMDYPGTRALLSLFKNLKGKCSIIVVTHTLDELLGLVDKLLFLYKGRVKAFGDLRSLFDLDELREYVSLIELLSKLKKKGFSFRKSLVDMDSLEEDIVWNVLHGKV